MRPDSILLKRIGRAVAFALVGAAIVATAVSMSGRTPVTPMPASTAHLTDPLDAELVRCREITRPDDVDDACRAAWAELRRRFFAPPPGGAAMTGGAGVIDGFTNTFSTYIDSGFGLLHGEVTYLASTLIAIDITLAGLFWAWGAEDDIMARLVKKVLFVGFFAFLIGNFNNLAQIIFNSFAGLGLEAAGSTVSATDFVHPGKIAQVGLDAGRPILTAAGQLMGFTSFFANFVPIFVLMLAWMVVLISFFIIAIQLFVTLIEFKLTTLAGFVLVPFGLLKMTAFLAEKVLGNVIASGVKVLVLAVIVGIGTTLFSQFTAGFPSNPNIEDSLSIMLGALTLLGLSIFGPGIATGLISGAPQLGAGAAVGTGLAAGGLAAAGIAGVGMAGQWACRRRRLGCCRCSRWRGPRRRRHDSLSRRRRVRRCHGRAWQGLRGCNESSAPRRCQSQKQLRSRQSRGQWERECSER